VLKEQPGPELVQIGSIAAAAPVTIQPAPKAAVKQAVKQVEEREEVGSFGD
jgi:hypothetical protein